jgi:hypothetical protein
MSYWFSVAVDETSVVSLGVPPVPPMLLMYVPAS